MDHLPKPSSATSIVHGLVPYVCLEGYDGGDFLGYPARIGLPPFRTVGGPPGELSYAHRKHLESMSKQEIESFYQSWLFFGLLHEILGSLYDPNEFVTIIETANGPTKLTSTAKLIGRLETWVKQVQDGSAELHVTYDHITKCMCLTHATMRDLRSDFNSDMKLSLVSLAEVLGYAASKAFKIGWEDNYQGGKMPLTWSLLIDPGYWAARLRASGWCASQIKILLDTSASLQTLHFLSCCKGTEGIDRHGHCGKMQCTAYQNDPLNYQTQHKNAGCTCEELLIDQDVTTKILESGSLPLIHINKHNTLAELSVDIVASNSASIYVALSHVWADGLGNPMSNALPRCQLSNIGEILKKLNIESNIQNDEKTQEFELWCDTLCCPIAPEQAKTLALEQMYQTYEQARCTLVLDNSLRMHSFDTLDLDEVCVRILFSPWMRRLWTLQEASLPAKKNRLWFQFRDRAVSILRIRTHIRDLYFSSIGHRGLARDLLRQLSTFANTFLKSLDQPGADLGTVAAGLQYRSVSVPSDEPLLIGTLLSLNVSQILGSPKPERMNQLWRIMPSALRGIPKDILFRVGPRLSQPGLRWAPSTMLLGNDKNGPFQATGNKRDQGVLTDEDGLLVRLLGIRLCLAQRPKGFPPKWRTIAQLANQNMLYIKVANTQWYSMHRRFSVEEDKYTTDQTLCATVQEGVETWMVTPASTLQTSMALLVGLEDTNDGIKNARSKLHVNFGPCLPPTQKWFNGVFDLAQQLANSTAARQLTIFEERDVDMNSVAYENAFLALKLKVQEIATNGDAKKVTASAEGITGQDGSKIIEEYIFMFFMGQYLCARDETLDTQQWCID